jgi:hypothetical protein
MDTVVAATKAGYQNAQTASYRLMKNPQIVAYLKRAKLKRQVRTKKTADNVLEYLERAVFLNPLKLFTPGGQGGWLCSKDDLKKIPDKIGMLIEEVEERTIETET